MEYLFTTLYCSFRSDVSEVHTPVKKLQFIGISSGHILKTRPSLSSFGAHIHDLKDQVLDSNSEEKSVIATPVSCLIGFYEWIDDIKTRNTDKYLEPHLLMKFHYQY